MLWSLEVKAEYWLKNSKFNSNFIQLAKIFKLICIDQFVVLNFYSDIGRKSRLWRRFF